MIPFLDSDLLAWTLVHSLWQFSLVGLAVAGSLRWLGRDDPRARHGLCLAGLVSLAALPVGTYLVLAAGAEARATSAALPAAASLVDVLGTWPESGAVTPAHPAGADPTPWSRWVLVAWLLGAGMCLVRTLRCWRHDRLMAHSGQLPAPAWLVHAARQLARDLDLGRPVRVVLSTLASVPTVIGWSAPVVLLPVAAVDALRPDQLRAVLAHELAHVARHDALVNLFQACLEVLFFFHPAVWWLSGRLRTEREYCCDDLAVTASGDALVFARALSTLDALAALPAPRAALSSQGGPLMDRITRLLGPTERAPAGRLAGASLGVVMLGTLSTSAAVLTDEDCLSRLLTIQDGRVELAVGDTDSDCTLVLRRDGGSFDVTCAEHTGGDGQGHADVIVHDGDEAQHQRVRLRMLDDDGAARQRVQVRTHGDELHAIDIDGLLADVDVALQDVKVLRSRDGGLHEVLTSTLDRLEGLDLQDVKVLRHGDGDHGDLHGIISTTLDDLGELDLDLDGLSRLQVGDGDHGDLRRVLTTTLHGLKGIDLDGLGVLHGGDGEPVAVTLEELGLDGLHRKHHDDEPVTVTVRRALLEALGGDGDHDHDSQATHRHRLHTTGNDAGTTADVLLRSLAGGHDHDSVCDVLVLDGKTGECIEFDALPGKHQVRIHGGEPGQVQVLMLDDDGVHEAHDDDHGHHERSAEPRKVIRGRVLDPSGQGLSTFTVPGHARSHLTVPGGQRFDVRGLLVDSDGDVPIVVELRQQDDGGEGCGDTCATDVGSQGIRERVILPDAPRQHVIRQRSGGDGERTRSFQVRTDDGEPITLELRDAGDARSRTVLRAPSVLVLPEVKTSRQAGKRFQVRTRVAPDGSRVEGIVEWPAEPAADCCKHCGQCGDEPAPRDDISMSADDAAPLRSLLESALALITGDDEPAPPTRTPLGLASTGGLNLRSSAPRLDVTAPRLDVLPERLLTPTFEVLAPRVLELNREVLPPRVVEPNRQLLPSRVTAPALLPRRVTAPEPVELLPEAPTAPEEPCTAEPAGAPCPEPADTIVTP